MVGSSFSHPRRVERSFGAEKRRWRWRPILLEKPSNESLLLPEPSSRVDLHTPLSSMNFPLLPKNAPSRFPGKFHFFFTAPCHCLCPFLFHSIVSIQMGHKFLLWLLFRLPVQLAGAQLSLTPLHSATASALFTSLLSLHNTNWGCLSEGILPLLPFFSSRFGLQSLSITIAAGMCDFQINFLIYGPH